MKDDEIINMLKYQRDMVLKYISIITKALLEKEKTGKIDQKTLNLLKNIID